MSKFNMSNKGTNTTSNLAGGRAYRVSDKEKLVKMVLTSFFNEPKYYGDTSNEIVETAKAIMDCDAKFVANLAIYARQVAHLRSVSQVLIVELANHPNGKEYVRKAMSKVIERVDDMTEIMSCYISNYGKPIPNSIKKGIADAFSKFDEYALAKYNRKKSVTLKDLLCIAHPKPVNYEQKDLWRRLLEDELQVPKTWETEVSLKGNTKAVWEELIKGKKLGYMASLRNLRNIVLSSASNIDDVLDYIQNPVAIKNSKQLPFRYLSAFRELENITYDNKVINALSNAIEIAVKNIPRLPGKTFMICDNSGSMNNTLSHKGSVSFKDIGALLMASAEQFCDSAITSVFGETFEIINVLSRDSIFSKMKVFRNRDVGCYTNLWTAMKYLYEKELIVDRIIVFTDEQCYNSGSVSGTASYYFQQYLKTINSKCILHLINLNCQDGTTQFVDKNVNYIAGWSERIFEFIPMFENGEGSLIEKIEALF